MFLSICRILGVALAALATILFGAWVTSPDPKFNPATFEDDPFETTISPLSTAVTLAQYVNDDTEIVTLLIESYDGAQIRGVDLANLGAARTADPFEALASIDDEKLSNAFSLGLETVSVPVSRVSSAGPTGAQHIGIGTNFPEHAEEAQSGSVFNFPKFGTATPARTTVSAPEGGLLDYEVELCLRFDRPIETLDDFDAAVKGFFLCADFTDRIKLLELADPDNLDSGYGFSA